MLQAKMKGGSAKFGPSCKAVSCTVIAAYSFIVQNAAAETK